MIFQITDPHSLFFVICPNFASSFLCCGSSHYCQIMGRCNAAADMCKAYAGARHSQRCFHHNQIFQPKISINSHINFEKNFLRPSGAVKLHCLEFTTLHFQEIFHEWKKVIWEYWTLKSSYSLSIFFHKRNLKNNNYMH